MPSQPNRRLPRTWHLVLLDIPSKPTLLVTTAGQDLVRGLAQWPLYGRLGWSDVKRRYRRTVLGPFWGAVNLALMVAALSGVGVGLWNQSAATYVPFLTSGLVVWVLISTMVTESTTVLVYGKNFVRQLRFDYSILVYALIWRNLITFLHNLVVYAVVIVTFAPELLRPVTLLAIPALVLVFVNGAWIALVLGICCLRYSDLQQLVGTLIQISIFITPIFWPESLLGAPYRHVFVTWNPIYHLIEIVRAPLIGQLPPLFTCYVVLGMAVVGWALAYLTFRSVRPRIAYWS
jgi:ABC-type polysaccharide/polyol phosphate export permease